MLNEDSLNAQVEAQQILKNASDDSILKKCFNEWKKSKSIDIPIFSIFYISFNKGLDPIGYIDIQDFETFELAREDWLDNSYEYLCVSPSSIMASQTMIFVGEHERFAAFFDPFELVLFFVKEEDIKDFEKSLTKTEKSLLDFSSINKELIEKLKFWAAIPSQDYISCIMLKKKK